MGGLRDTWGHVGCFSVSRKSSKLVRVSTIVDHRDEADVVVGRGVWGECRSRRCRSPKEEYTVPWWGVKGGKYLCLSVPRATASSWLNQ